MLCEFWIKFRIFLYENALKNIVTGIFKEKLVYVSEIMISMPSAAITLKIWDTQIFITEETVYHDAYVPVRWKLKGKLEPVCPE